MRSCQQDELYSAERSITQGFEFHSVDEVQEYVDQMRDTPWWERNFSQVRRVEVIRWQKGKADGGGYAGDGIGVVPWHPAWHELIVVHEVTHALASARFQSHAHDPWFARVYLEAVWTYMGPDAYVALRRAFGKHGVDHDTMNTNPAGVVL